MFSAESSGNSLITSLAQALAGGGRQDSTSVKYSLSGFLGMFPRYQAYLIKDSAAQLSIDTNTLSGGLEAYRQDKMIKRTEKLYTDFYRYVHDNKVMWLSFDEHVDIARSAVIDDVSNQTFVTGIDNNLRIFDATTLQVDALYLQNKVVKVTKDNSVLARIDRPKTAKIKRTGAGALDAGSTVSRAYSIAYVREWQSGKLDFGPLSEAARQEPYKEPYIDVDATHHAVVYDIKVPEELDSRVTHIEIYRSTVDSKGTSDWRKVVRFPINGGLLPLEVEETSDGVYQYTDKVLDEYLQDTPQNENWTCPEGLKGICTLKNGCFAGFVNNTVYLSVPYQGHAWPEEYAIPLDFEVVGLGTFGNVLVICTTSNTYLCTISKPDTTILVPIQEPCACVSQKSIVSIHESVVFATDFGLVRVTQNGLERLTNEIIHEEMWRRYNPKTIIASAWHGQYLMFFDSNKVEYNGCVLDFQNVKSGIFGLSQKVYTLRKDDYSSDVFIQYVHPMLSIPCFYAFAASNSLKRIYRWVSKKFINNQGTMNLAAAKVNFLDDSFRIENLDFVFNEDSHAFNAPFVNKYSIAGDSNTNLYTRTVFATQWCKFSIWVDDRHYFTYFPRDNKPFRIPAGKRADSCFFEIVSTEPISRVQVASSIGELE